MTYLMMLALGISAVSSNINGCQDRIDAKETVDKEKEEEQRQSSGDF